MTIASEFEIPELFVDNNHPIETNIKFGEIPNSIGTKKSAGVLVNLSANDFIFLLDTVGSYRVQDGRLITIDPHPYATQNEIHLFLLGSVFGALLHQRGLLPIHGSTVVKDSKATIFTGESSIGKSTLAAKLTKKGYSILTDDIASISFNQNLPIVNPGIPRIKLWEDVIRESDLTHCAKQVRPKMSKYMGKFGFEFINQPVLLQRIVLLKNSNRENTEFRQIHGIEKFNLLKENIYREQFICGKQQQIKTFKNITTLLNSVKIYEISRPSNFAFLRNFPDLIDNFLNNCDD